MGYPMAVLSYSGGHLAAINIYDPNSPGAAVQG